MFLKKRRKTAKKAIKSVKIAFNKIQKDV